MDNAKFYQAFKWEDFTDADINIKYISELIPSDVTTIIDIGCGNGLITNALSKKYKILGVDRSSNALEFVKTEKLLSDCDNINVSNNSFDLVLSSELLEHLPENIYLKTIEEFSRISKSYVLISVPNEESINKGMICCPKCKYIYHRNLHMRSFTEDSIQQKFNQFEVLKVVKFGLKVRQYNKFLSKIKHRFTNPNSWIPWFWTKGESRNSFCPNCENTFINKYEFSLIGLFLDISNIFISSKKEFWLLVLLKRK